MKKKLVASLAAAVVLGVAGTSFAASNPFVDVPANNWAYSSVSKLVRAGIIDGYGDGTFRGDKTVTRYEMAQMVAKAMGNEAKANEEQKAEIKKLQAEFADELDKLGVRVDKLEKNQPNLKFNGNLLLRYNAKDMVNDQTKTDNTAAYYRLRLDGKAVVDENTTFNFRFVTRDPMKLDSVVTAPVYKADGTLVKAGKTSYWNSSAVGLPTCLTTSKFGTENALDGSGTSAAGFDRYNLVTKMGSVTTTVGRQALVVGTTSGIVDAGAFSFDGLKFAAPLGKVNAAVNYGRLVDRKDVGSIELSTKTGKLNYGVGYFTIQDHGSNVAPYGTIAGSIVKTNYIPTNDVNPNTTTANTFSLGEDMLKLWYGNVTYNFDSRFSMTAEYGQNKADYATQDNKYLNLWAVYGDQVLNAKGKSNVKFQYWNVGANALALDASGAGLTTLDTTGSAGSTGFKGWDLSYNRAFSKNLSSEFHYVKVTDNTYDVNNYNYYRVNVVAKF